MKVTIEWISTIDRGQGQGHGQGGGLGGGSGTLEEARDLHATKSTGSAERSPAIINSIVGICLEAEEEIWGQESDRSSRSNLKQSNAIHSILTRRTRRRLWKAGC